MAKAKTHYVCSQCGGISVRWQGQCSQCLSWNTLEENVVESSSPVRNRFQNIAGQHSGLQRLSDVTIQQEQRVLTGIAEFDRVLGGGVTQGAVILIGGDPGIGKSTLLLQAMSAMAQHSKAIYVSGEESVSQVALRFQRLQLESTELKVMTEINLEHILSLLAREQPQIVVIDSIQTIYSEQLQSVPGSVAQVKECAARLTRFAKQSGCVLIMVGHVTKDGSLAGPRVLEHMVDTVLYFEGDTHSSFRLIRAFKNRFGAVNELGVFAMTEKGLRGINNPSAIFLTGSEQEVAGSCVVVTLEGTRPLLVEVQALVDNANNNNARRLSVGLEQNRLAMLLAVMHRHVGIVCADQDVFINAVGGVKITEPAADLAVVLAIISSLKNRPLPKKLIVFGEVGLTGEIRPAPRGQERLKEAVKLGFTTAIIPKANQAKQPIEGLTVISVERIEQAVHALRELDESY